MFQNEQQYGRFRLNFRIPQEWSDRCINVHKLHDFLTLAAGVRLYGLFNYEPCDQDQYFLEHMGIVVEVKHVDKFNFLMQRRPDIQTIRDGEFDASVIDKNDVVDFEGDSQLEVDFRLASPSPDNEAEEEEEKEEEEEVEEEEEEQVTIEELKIEEADEMNNELSNGHIEEPEENNKKIDEEDESVEMTEVEPIDLSLPKNIENH